MGDVYFAGKLVSVLGMQTTPRHEYTCIGIALCAECALHHDCANRQDATSPVSCDVEPGGEPVGETGDSTWQSRSWEPDYVALRELWAPHGLPMARLKDDMWVAVVSAPELCPLWPQRCRAFGEEINDFSMLCEALAWEFPQGAAFVQVDKKKTIVCVPGQPTHQTEITSALSWLRASRGQTFGIALRSVGDRLQGAFLEVLFHPRRDCDETTRRRRAILKAVTEVTTVP